MEFQEIKTLSAVLYMSLIREASLSDIEELFGIRSTVPELYMGDDSPQAERKRWEDDVSIGRGCCLVYERNDEIVGFIWAQHLEEDGKLIGRIRYLYVDTEHRRGGIASKLYESCEARLREKFYVKIRSGTAPDNFAIHRMCEKYGFHFLGIKRSGDKDNPLAFYEKDLQ